MKILAFFTSNGIPATGLIPIIRIRNLLDNSLVVTDAVMSEVGDGHYQYNFTSYNKDTDYAIRCDGGISLSGIERYTYAGNENYIDDISESITENTSASFSSLNTNILGASASIINDISQVAGDVWDEQLANHTILGTYGNEVATKADIQASVSTIETVAASGAIIFGTLGGGVYTDTFSRDGIYWHVEESVVNGLTVQMAFNIPDGNRAGVVKVFGRYMGVPSSTHYMELWVYNYPSMSWEQLTEIFLPGGNTSDAEYIHEYFERHIDRDNNNEVRIRLVHNVSTYIASHDMYLDYVAVTSIDVIIAEDIANAVWSENPSGYSGLTSFGGLVKDINNDFIDLNTKVDSLSASNQINFNNLNSVITNYTTQILNSMSGIDTRIISLSASNKFNFDVISSLLTSYTTDILTEIGITDTRIISLSASNQTNFNTVNSNISSISISAGATPQQIANAVWSENPSGYSGLTSFGGLARNMSNDIKRLLGLTHENIFIDNPTYDGDGNMTSARVRIYSNPSSVGTGSDVIGTYQVSAPSSAPGQFITWSQIRNS